MKIVMMEDRKVGVIVGDRVETINPVLLTVVNMCEEYGIAVRSGGVTRTKDGEELFFETEEIMRPGQKGYADELQIELINHGFAVVSEESYDQWLKKQVLIE